MILRRIFSARVPDEALCSVFGNVMMSWQTRFQRTVGAVSVGIGRHFDQILVWIAKIDRNDLARRARPLYRPL